MTITIPQPIRVKTGDLATLPSRYRQAARNASDCLPIEGDEPVRIEVYRTEDVRRIVEEVWRWPCTLAAVTRSDDRHRVQVIMELLRKKKPRWPYVSYWADTIEELVEVEQHDGGEFSVINHGDGWHRIIAAVELGLPTIEIMYLT